METPQGRQNGKTSAETIRRRAVWVQMQLAARETLRAVTIEARAQQVYGQTWLGGIKELEACIVTFLTHRAWVASRPGSRRKLEPGEPREHRFTLHGSGSLERPSKTAPHEGYPDLNQNDVRRFRHAATRALRIALAAHIHYKQAQKGRR